MRSKHERFNSGGRISAKSPSPATAFACPRCFGPLRYCIDRQKHTLHLMSSNELKGSRGQFIYSILFV